MNVEILYKMNPTKRLISNKCLYENVQEYIYDVT